MTEIFNFIFDNFLLVVVILAIYYVYHEYKDLKEKTTSINELFDKVLNKYLDEKFLEARNVAEKIIREHSDNDVVMAEASRVLATIDKANTGLINDKVTVSNVLNKFKLNKEIDFEKYPYLLELEKLGTFTEEDLNSVDNGVAIARKEYNAQVFRYNEKASSSIMQYLTKFLKLNQQYIIFDAPKSSFYEDNYEVFEEEEPEINFLSTLNRKEEEEEVSLNDLILKQQPDHEEVVIEHSDLILKPTKEIEEGHDVVFADDDTSNDDNKKN